MPVISVPASLKPYTQNQNQLRIDSETVLGALTKLIETYPQLQPYLFNKERNLNHCISLYLNGRDVRFNGGLDAPVTTADTLTIVPAIAGG